MEWYRCTDKAEAQKMLDDINALPIFPRVGRNALTKEPEPTKQQTLCWREEVIEGKDGSFGFPALTKDEMGKLNVPRKEESSVPIFEDKYIFTKEEETADFKPAEIVDIKVIR